MTLLLALAIVGTTLCVTYVVGTTIIVLKNMKRGEEIRARIAAEAKRNINASMRARLRR